MAELGIVVALPPGWVRIPLDRAEAGFAAITAQVMEQAPPEKAALIRQFLETQLSMALEAAREQAVREFILPLKPVLGVPIPASIVVTTLTPPSGDTRSPQEALVAMAAAGDARAIEMDGLVGIRRVRSVTASAGAAISAEAPAHRNISYICHIPWSDEWIAFTASILTSDDPELEDQLSAVEVLIDAIIATVRFQRVEQPTPSEVAW